MCGIVRHAFRSTKSFLNSRSTVSSQHCVWPENVQTDWRFQRIAALIVGSYFCSALAAMDIEDDKHTRLVYLTSVSKPYVRLSSLMAAISSNFPHPGEIRETSTRGLLPTLPNAKSKLPKFKTEEIDLASLRPFSDNAEKAEYRLTAPRIGASTRYRR